MDPFILTHFVKPDNLQGDPLVSLVVFEWADKDLIGHPVNDQGYGAVSSHNQGCRDFTDVVYSGNTSAMKQHKKPDTALSLVHSSSLPMPQK